ncbi:MAG: CHC2 zinc finger domain-containing protein [Methylococcaceae bacterium]
MQITPEQIKAAIAPADYYQNELPGVILKRHGWNDAGLCVFHDDTQKGSFRVNTETGAYCCFACRIKGGDIIAFEMEKYGLSFTKALDKLAGEWGLSW